MMKDKEKAEVWLDRNLTEQEESLSKLTLESLKNLGKMVEKQSGQSDNIEELETKLSASRNLYILLRFAGSSSELSIKE